MGEKEKKIRELKRLYRRTKSKYMKNDLRKGINRLQRELNNEKNKKE